MSPLNYLGLFILVFSVIHYISKMLQYIFFGIAVLQGKKDEIGYDLGDVAISSTLITFGIYLLKF